MGQETSFTIVLYVIDSGPKYLIFNCLDDAMAWIGHFYLAHCWQPDGNLDSYITLVLRDVPKKNQIEFNAFEKGDYVKDLKERK